MKFAQSVVISVLLLGASASQAGIYGDDMARCLVESSTSADKIKLVQWMFTAMSLHPAVQELAAVGEKDRNAANKGMADLMLDLVTVRCLEQAKKAIKYEGQAALQAGFSVFGQVAGQELFANPNVAAGLSGLEEHLDSDTMNKRLGITP